MDIVKIISWIWFIFFLWLLFATETFKNWLLDLAWYIKIWKEDFFSQMPPELLFLYTSVLIILVIYFIRSYRK